MFDIVLRQAVLAGGNISMARTDKGVAPSVDNRLQELGYLVSEWSSNRTDFIPELTKTLSTASKKQTNNIGLPDRIYINTNSKLLILVEEKPLAKDHDNPDIEKGAISGIKWYLSRFSNANLDKSLKHFWDYWQILGIAVSGDLQSEYAHKFSCFSLDCKNECIKPLPQITNFMTKEQTNHIIISSAFERTWCRISC